MNEMKNATIRNEYIREAFAAFFGTFGMALYYFTDGLFIGNAVGDDGMSAITISWNIVLFLTAVAGAIGMGGSIRFTVSLGRSGIPGAAQVLRTTLRLLAGTAFVLTVGLLLLEEPLLQMLGAYGRVLVLCRQYSTTVLIWTPVQLAGLGLLPLVRNLGGHRLAGIAMSAGYVVNFLLDWVLMVWFPLGMFGCSLAYIAGQTVIALPCVVFIFRKYNRKFKKQGAAGGGLRRAAEIVGTGAAPFGLYFSQAVVSAVISRRFLRCSGSAALAGYTVIVYAAGIVNTLHRAVMEGSQPLISRYSVKQDPGSAAAAAGGMYLFSMSLIFVGAVLSLALKQQIVGLFGVSEGAEAQVSQWLPAYLLGYSCISFSRTVVSHLSAIDRTLPAALLTYLEPVCVLGLVSLLPTWLGPDGIWIGIITAYTLTGICAAAILGRTMHARKAFQRKWRGQQLQGKFF